MNSDRIPAPALPPSATPAVEIVRRLTANGHQSLLAGGCVRDLLLGSAPSDFDVATDAPPQRVMQLFRPTRHVGAQFGVVLVKQRDRWVEVATFRTDGEYRDGRRPESVTYSTAREDAQRRDFTVNGMFVDPLSGEVFDFVGGRADLAAGVVRAIGDPGARFAEDHLRLLRAVRFAARLGFTIEAATADAMRRDADKLPRVSAERIREELAKMLAAPTRATAVRLLGEHELLRFVFRDVQLSESETDRALTLLARLPVDATFELALAVLLGLRAPGEVDELCRFLTCANDERDAVVWLVANQSALDDPGGPSLASFKRLMATRWFGSLRALAEARYAEFADGATRRAALRARCDSIPAEAIAPPPFVTGEDLLARGVTPGPIYGEWLAELYSQQLDEALTSRPDALRALDELLSAASQAPPNRNRKI